MECRQQAPGIFREPQKVGGFQQGRQLFRGDESDIILASPRDIDNRAVFRPFDSLIIPPPAGSTGAGGPDNAVLH